MFFMRWKYFADVLAQFTFDGIFWVLRGGEGGGGSVLFFKVLHMISAQKPKKYLSWLLPSLLHFF